MKLAGWLCLGGCSNACGGGERVLWLAIKALSDLHVQGKQKLHVFIYSGDQGIRSQDILQRAEVSTNTSMNGSHDAPLP